MLKTLLVEQADPQKTIRYLYNGESKEGSWIEIERKEFYEKI